MLCTERTVSSARECDLEITAEGGTPICAVAGYMTVAIMTCCTLVELVLMWRTPHWVAVATSRGTQTLDGDVEHGHANTPPSPKVMITRHGEAVDCMQDCPFFVKSHSINTLSLCSHCYPNDSSSKRAWRRRSWI